MRENSDKGISSTVGVTMMIAITVVIAAVIMVAVTGIGGDLTEGDSLGNAVAVDLTENNNGTVTALLETKASNVDHVLVQNTAGDSKSMTSAGETKTIPTKGDTVTVVAVGSSGDKSTVKSHDPSSSGSVSPETSLKTESGNTSFQTGDSIMFNGSESVDNDGSISSYEWDFGDGNTASGETVTHSYSSSGTYTVELTTTDSDGNTQSDTMDVTINPSYDMIVDADNGPNTDYTSIVNAVNAAPSSGTTTILLRDGTYTAYRPDFVEIDDNIEIYGEGMPTIEGDTVTYGSDGVIDGVRFVHPSDYAASFRNSDMKVVNSTFDGNYYDAGVDVSSSQVEFKNTTFVKSGVLVDNGASVTIKNSDLGDTGWGVESVSGSATIQNSTIGTELNAHDSQTISAKNNWWETTDESTIQSRITEGSGSTVTYDPWCTDSSCTSTTGS